MYAQCGAVQICGFFMLFFDSHNRVLREDAVASHRELHCSMVSRLNRLTFFIKELACCEYHRLAIWRKNFDFITFIELVALFGIYPAVPAILDHCHNIILADISAVFVILTLSGVAEEKSETVSAVAYLVDLVFKPLGQLIIIGV